MRKFSVNFWIAITKRPMLLIISMFFGFYPIMTILSFFISYELVLGILALMVLFMFITYRFYMAEEKKEKNKRENWEDKEYIQKYQKYIDLIHETEKEINYTVQIPDEYLVKTFDNCIRSIIYGKRTINNFDISACLICAFILEKSSIEEMAFAFECVKKLISTPTVYFVCWKMGENFDFELKEVHEEVYINLPNENFSIEEMISIFKAYFEKQTGEAILKLSDFLHILYLKCKT